MESSFKKKIGHQYNKFQNTIEQTNQNKKYLNYGYSCNLFDSMETRQERLCLSVFNMTEIKPNDIIVDVGFGSGEQDFLLEKNYAFKKLIGFNIAEEQVHYANNRAYMRNLQDKLKFVYGMAEELPDIEACSIDKIFSIECAFYFDRSRFYKRAAEVLKHGGKMVLADISLNNPFGVIRKFNEDFNRFGTISSNKAKWEKYFITKEVKSIRSKTFPGAMIAGIKIINILLRNTLSSEEYREWLKMALYCQGASISLLSGIYRYDLITLEKK
ncbi:MAG: class I SAM-dependent methyltransferase [Nitrospinae bacterium]|nr:class I SAM-dependent methyltransferase [Nitrospinota bacterium]